MHRRITPSLVIALLALVVAVGGGTAFAASKYIITSTKQIKPSVRKALKGKKGPAGAQGPQGMPGLRGPQGPAGPVNVAKLVRVTATGTVAPSSSGPPFVPGVVTVNCPSGHWPVSGGYFTDAGSVGLVTAQDSFGDPGWTVKYVNLSPSATPAQVTAVAYCAPSGAAVAAH